MYKVYLITNLKNEMKYVGMSKNPKTRKYAHFKVGHVDGSKAIHQDLAIFSKEDFTFEVVSEYDTKEVALDAEAELIEKYDTFNNGYNLTPGGQGLYKGWKGNSTSKRKGDQEGEKNSFYGKHHTEETKRLLSEQRKGKTYEERFGVKKALEISKKLSDAGKGRDAWNKGKPMITKNCKQVSINGKTYLSLADAVRDLGLSGQVIRKRCKDEKHTEWYYIQY